jgi:protein-tyrosine phosphatase
MRLLFVCLGNICRSPAAESVLREMLDREGLAASVQVDSAGTTGYHIGSEPDPRTRKALEARGYRQWSKARLVEAQDFLEYDLILAMDQQNMRELRRLCPKHELMDKVKLAASFCTQHSHSEVPDPYYGEKEDFVLVIDLAEDFCQNIVHAIKEKRLGT